MIVLDAAGLALFAVAGTQKALIYKMHPFSPFCSDHYRSGWRHDSRYVPGPRTQCLARPCLCHRSHGRIGGDDPRPKGGTAPTLAAILGGGVRFGLRLVSVWQHWNLPRVAA